MCSYCEMAVIWMQNQLVQNKSLEQVLNYLDELCERIPSPMGESAVDCSSLSSMPVITFNIGGRNFDLRPEQYILKVASGGSEQCISGFTALDVPLWYVTISIMLLRYSHSWLKAAVSSSSDVCDPIHGRPQGTR
ncbi:hypothetical protein B296_00032618 [Ensete ventricosum]|uniref:Saposin B-type domain-containing protein n=1 Tax=Ensete ventricosum TaxID=4639 RepID=A0A426YAP0_ENSVE|nr:hypothetical protein B296_00032618 [Ensete ventricosum]